MFDNKSIEKGVHWQGESEFFFQAYLSCPTDPTYHLEQLTWYMESLRGWRIASWRPCSLVNSCPAPTWKLTWEWWWWSWGGGDSYHEEVLKVHEKSGDHEEVVKGEKGADDHDDYYAVLYFLVDSYLEVCRMKSWLREDVEEQIEQSRWLSRKKRCSNLENGKRELLLQQKIFRPCLPTILSLQVTNTPCYNL